MSWRNDLEAQRRHFLARRRLVTLLIRQSGTEQCVLYACMVFEHSRVCPPCVERVKVFAETWTKKKFIPAQNTIYPLFTQHHRGHIDLARLPGYR